MSDDTTVIFLGINDAGKRVYDWLCDRDGVFVQALFTTKEQLSQVADFAPDYLVSVGYRHLVPEEVLAVPSEGCLNLHPALLPYNRGANPNVWPLIDGTPAGVTLHYMDESLDTGDVVAQREVETDFADTAKDLYERLEDVQVDVFTDAWPRIVAGEADAQPQDGDSGTYHTTAEFDEMCSLNPDEEYTVKEFLDRLRALTFPPYDNASLEVDGTEYTVEVSIERR